MRKAWANIESPTKLEESNVVGKICRLLSVRWLDDMKKDMVRCAVYGVGERTCKVTEENGTHKPGKSWNGRGRTVCMYWKVKGSNYFPSLVQVIN